MSTPAASTDPGNRRAAAVRASERTVVARTPDAAGTRALAAALAPLCRPGDVLLLAGDLGAGKTTFAQGFGRALGITEPVTSPTFTLVRQYPLGVDAGPGGDGTAGGGAGGQGGSGDTDRSGGGAGGGPGGGLRMLLHADVYRLDALAEVVDLGLGELVEDGGVALVEWGDVAAPVLGDGALLVRLETPPLLAGAATGTGPAGDTGGKAFSPDQPGDPAETERLVTVAAEGPRWADRWETLESVLRPWVPS